MTLRIDKRFRIVHTAVMSFLVDYNECEAKRDLCDENARCANNAGSYKCFCLAGYIGDGFTCESEYDRLTRCLQFIISSCVVMSR